MFFFPDRITAAVDAAPGCLVPCVQSDVGATCRGGGPSALGASSPHGREWVSQGERREWIQI